MRHVPTLLALACAACVSAADPAGLRQEASLLIDGDGDGITYSGVEVSGGRWFPGTWRGEERAQRLIQGLLPVPANRWSTATIRFTPVKSGQVRLILLARNSTAKDDPTPPGASAIVWDAVEAQGATLVNGGFEDGTGPIPAGWESDKPVDSGRVKLVRDPLLLRAGTAAVRVEPATWFSQKLRVEAGKPVAITLSALRPVGVQSQAVGLASAANMGLRDEKDNDGKGGWTDQGKANDLAGLATGEQVFADVRFQIGSGATATIVLRGPTRPALPATAILQLPARSQSPRHLYLLHGGAWMRSAAGEIGRIVPLHADGSAAPAIPVLAGRDLGDWWSPATLANAVVAWTVENGSAYVGLYVSHFELPAGAPVTALRFESANVAVWGIAGASLSDEAVAMPTTEARTMAADETWRPLAMHRDIVAGSALDLSGLLDAPAGKHGFVSARDGRLEFGDGTRARFAGNNFSPMDPKAILVSDGELDRLADRFARLGINLVRVSHVDASIRLDDDTGPALVPAALDRFDRLVAAFKQRGIYVTLDLFMGRWTQAITDRRFPGFRAKGGHSRSAYESAFPVDQEFRDDLKAWARLLLTHVNPYTGLAYLDEPAFAFIGMNNEDPLPALLGSAHGGNMPPEMAPLYRTAFTAFLRKVHGSSAALAAAWGPALGSGESLENGVALDLVPTGRRGEDSLRFLVAAQGDGWAEMDAYLRSLGLKIPLADCNMTNSRFAALLRTRFALVDNHGYWDHPKFLRNPWALPYGYSQRALVRPGRWWSRDNHALEMAASRHAGKPFTVSEYDHVFPNRHRSEAGIVFGGIAALQDWDGVMQFTYGSDPRSLWEGDFPAKPFDKVNEPVGLATEAQLRFLYLRGDLKPAPAMVELFAPGERVAQSDWTLGPEADLLAFVTRTGLNLGAAPTPGASTLPIHAQAEAGTTALPRPKSGDPADLAAWFASIKARILPPGNRSDPAQGFMESATGEMRWEFNRGLVLVDTPRSRGGVVKEKTTLVLSGLEAEVDAAAASFTVHSLDAAPLETSKRLLVILATDVLNQGMRLEDEGRVVVTWGQAQKLLRTGRATLTLTHAGPLRAWALDTAGKRLGEIPVTAAEGRVSVTFDQQAQPGLYWELAAE